MVTQRVKTNIKATQVRKPSVNGRTHTGADDFLDVPEELHLEEFNYEEVKAAAEAMIQHEKELQRKGIKETEAERDLRIYGTKDLGELTTMEMLRRNPCYAKRVLDSDRAAREGRVTPFVPFE